MSDQAERFRQKVRDRNLGKVPVQTYPANPEAADRARVLSKLELHRKAQEEPAKPEPEAPGELSPAPAKPEPAKSDEKRK